MSISAHCGIARLGQYAAGFPGNAIMFQATGKFMNYLLPFTKKGGKTFKLDNRNYSNDASLCRNQNFFPQKVGGINTPTKVHIHQRTQHKQQTGRKWKPLCIINSMTQSSSWKLDGMSQKTQVLQWTAINTSEGIGKE